MNYNINPFQDLYVADDAKVGESFVALFSKEVLQTAINPVFQGANVVLSGTQGCGKTMILNLLRPEIRIAYWDSGKADEFPIHKEMRDFVSAGVNLTHKRAADLVQVTLNKGDGADLGELPLYFGDFFNYAVILDLLKSITKMIERPDVFEDIVTGQHLDDFAVCLAKSECWFGALADVATFGELKTRISARLDIYRSWTNGNLDGTQAQDVLRGNKTQVGVPLSRAAACLREALVIRQDIPVLVRVDQIEELHRALSERQRKLLLEFRKVLNRAFAARDSQVRYRIGSRRYGWNNPRYLGIWGSGGQLENRRDYHLIDMDVELFARGEESNTIFERFASDAFHRRVAYYNRNESQEIKQDIADSILGRSPKPFQRLEQLNTNPSDAQIDRALALDVGDEPTAWSEEWRNFLRKMYRAGHEGMLDATLAAAWGRQTGGARAKVQHRCMPPPENAPWRERKWWKKERLDMAVLQLLTRNQQRMIWYGYKDICSLSGGNITVFLHICHRVWDSFLKQQSSRIPRERLDLLASDAIPREIQSAGILLASNEWYKKLSEEPDGNSRRDFVEQLGIKLNQKMVHDLAMSYPGGNGISISLSEYNSETLQVQELREFLHDAIGYGALFSVEHSSRNPRQGKRIKFHLNPIFSPRFQLPEAKTKEPYYWKLQELLDFASKANVTLSRLPKKRVQESTEQGLLPGTEEYFE